MQAVSNRAAQLHCKVIGVLGNVILCQRTTDNTFITWRATVHSFDNGVQADFISGCYDMAQGQANANLIERALGEQPAPVKTYTVWNPEHIAMTADTTVETYEDLIELEERTTYSYSSSITTDDIDGVVNAVQNEFNGELQYHEHSEVIANG